MQKKIRILLAVTLLLGSGIVLAGNGKSHADHDDHDDERQDCSHMPPGQAKKNPNCQSAHRGGPPPWAPAHGNRKHKDDDDDETRHVHERESVRVSDEIGISAGTCRRELIGAILGGVVGGVIGNKVGDPGSKNVTTVAGAVLGVLVGKTIGRRMDKKDQQCAGQVLERAADGKRVRWVNDDGMEFNVTPQRTFNRNGQSCREFQTVSKHNGKSHKEVETACRNSSGAWQVVNL